MKREKCTQTVTASLSRDQQNSDTHRKKQALNTPNMRTQSRNNRNAPETDSQDKNKTIAICVLHGLPSITRFGEC